MSEDKFLVHRDDIPYPLMEQLERDVAKAFPGMKVICVGDLPPEQIPLEVREQVQRFKQQCRASREQGLCLHCGRAMPNYQQLLVAVQSRDAQALRAWQPAEGWGFSFVGFKKPKEFLGWICPECHK